MIFQILFFYSIAEDLNNANEHVMAQAFMERCIDQSDDEVMCRGKTIDMFGTTGLTEIDVDIAANEDENEKKEYMPIKILFHKGSRDNRSITCSKSECIAPNTIYYGGQCHCRLFFDYGKPFGQGCWRCKPTCNANSICTINGKCICKNYTVSKGFNKCQAHIPTILRSYVKRDKKTVIVEINPVPWEYPRVAYCKFSKIIVEGILTTNHTIKCVRRTSLLPETRVDVSWDSSSFSHQKAEIIRKDLSETDIGPIIVGITVIFLLIIAYFLFLLNRKASREMKFDEYAKEVEMTGML